MRADMSLCRIGSQRSLTLLHMVAEVVGGTPFYAARNLFVTKQARIKHHGLKNWLSQLLIRFRVLSMSENKEII